MKREKILRSKGYNITKIQNELYRQLTSYLKEKKITRTQFAKELGVSKGYVSQILNGNFDYKLSKLVELSLAIGKIPEIKYTSLDELDKPFEKDLKIVHLKEKRFNNYQSNLSIKSLNFNNCIQEVQEYKIAQ